MRVRRLKLPMDRIGVAIGPKGRVKKKIEDKTGTTLSMSSESGQVIIESTDDNPLGVLTAKDVLTAIGRGFSPTRAYRLFDEQSYLEVLDITSYTGRSVKAQNRYKGRLIGERGKTRRIIEETTGASISIYGKTVSSIGTPEQLEVVREAVKMILSGAPHSAVYSFLERKRREQKRKPTLWR